MSAQIYFEGYQANISLVSFFEVIQHYIPVTIFNKTQFNRLNLTDTFFFEEDGLEHVQNVLDKSNHKLRMYGRAAELCQNLKIFRNIDFDYQLFRLDLCEPYSTRPVIYKSLKGKSYISKHDVFVHIQNMIFENFEVISRNLFARAVICAFLKTHQISLDASHEFVPCDCDEFQSIESDFVEQMRRANTMPTSFKLVRYSHEEILNQFKPLIPMEWDDKTFQKIHIFLSEAIGRAPPKSSPKYYATMYSACKHITTALIAIMATRANIFKSYTEATLQFPKVVRCFEDGKRKFVPCDEIPDNLLSTLEKCGSDPKSGDLWITMNGLNCIQYINTVAPNVEIIRVPISRTKHRASVVCHVEKAPHLLAVDVLLELLYEWMFGVKMFQRVKNEVDWKSTVVAFFEKFSVYFRPDMENIYFIPFSVINKFVEWTLKLDLTMIRIPAKDVRNARPDGFTEQHLKNELLNLGLNDLFPNITDHTALVYAHVCKQKKESVLRTCDLYDAVYHCQLIEFFKKFPMMATFVHNQNGCHRVLDIDCPCKKTTTSDERKNEQEIKMDAPKEEHRESVHPVDGKREEAGSEATTSTNDIQEGVAPDESKNEQKIDAPASTCNEGKNKKKKKNKNKKKERSEPVEAVKEPEKCEKCVEANKVCEQLRGELAEARKKMLSTKQELIDNQKKESKRHEKELKDWKKVIGNLESKVEEVEESAKKQVEEVEEKLANIEQVNVALEEEINKLRRMLEEEAKEKSDLEKNYMELSLLNAQKDLTIQNLQRQSAQKPTELSLEMKRTLADLQDKRDLLKSENLKGNAAKRQSRLNSISTREVVKQMARLELKEFYVKHDEYQKALETNIEIIQGNVSVTIADLVPVPEPPVFSELFEQEFLKAEQENEQFGEECQICLMSKSSNKRLFKCPHCSVTYHNRCINDWKKCNAICPSCRKSL